jgi:hypothetical protein
MRRRRESCLRFLRAFSLMCWLVLAVILFMPTSAYADDCTRDPLNAADCMRTGGFRQGITVVIGGAATAGVVVSNVISAGATGALPQPQIPAQPAQVTPPEQISPQPPGLEDWQRKWIEKGWRWSEEEGGLVPHPGAVNEKGQIWYRPPWDQGGEYWVDKATFDECQEYIRDGYQWSDRWGWKPPEEIRQLDAERDRRWREFTDPEAGKRRHEKLMRDVREAVENDTEYQRIKQELDRIDQRLKEMERQSLRDEMAFNQRMAAIHERRDRLLGYLEAPVRAIKWTADTSIDILGGIPGAPQKIKYVYKATTNFIETSIEKQSLWEGTKKAVIETGKDIIGDKIGDAIKTPSIDLPKSAKDMPVKQLFTKQGLPTVGKLGANYGKGKLVGWEMDRQIANLTVTSDKSTGMPPMVLAGM